MTTDNEFQNITNLIIITTILTDANSTDSTQPTDNDDLKNILSYAVPLSCLAIILVLLVVFAIYHRRRILDKCSSLKQMRNTNPKFRQSVGIRRDSEFDSYDYNDANTTTTNQENSCNNEPDHPLKTII